MRTIIDGPHARYTFQTIIAGYALPGGHEVHHATSKGRIADYLLADHLEAERYGAGYEPSEALIWIGHHNDITDIYPDLRAVIGPRGGVRFEPC